MIIGEAKNIFFSLVCALLIWGGALVSIDMGPVPLTLQTSAILLTALLLPMGYAVFSVILYIFLGLVGLPVFAGGRSGIEVLTGPTNGFIVGFVVATFMVSYLSKPIRFNVRDKKLSSIYWQAAWPCILGSLTLQFCGVVWGKIYSDAPWDVVLDQYLHPFYLNMVLKIIISVLAAVQIWQETSKEVRI